MLSGRSGRGGVQHGEVQDVLTSLVGKLCGWIACRSRINERCDFRLLKFLSMAIMLDHLYPYIHGTTVLCDMICAYTSRIEILDHVKAFQSYTISAAMTDCMSYYILCTMYIHMHIAVWLDHVHGYGIVNG